MADNIRPWGEYHIIEQGDTYKVKRITVKPNEELSYQFHRYREETWTIVHGFGLLVLDDIEYIVKESQSINIPIGAKHKIKNVSDTQDLVFIEVQLGNYLEEDDIVRLNDKYGRS